MDKILNVKRQHYVPKFYLKNFSMKKDSEYIINCFDKLEEKEFPSNINKIACKHFFYDSQLTENALSKLETIFSQPYKKLLTSNNLNELSKEEKSIIAYFVANQFLRTIEFRRRIKSISTRLKVILKTYKNKEQKKISKELEKLMEDKEIKGLQTKTLKDYVPIYAEIILNMKWALITNQTSIPFWTSDNPVNNYNSLEPPPYGDCSIHSKGIIVYFPLNTKRLLTINDPIVFKDLPEIFEYRRINEIELQNKLQVIWSSRYIYSITNNFFYAKKILKEHPALKYV